MTLPSQLPITLALILPLVGCSTLGDPANVSVAVQASQDGSPTSMAEGEAVAPDRIQVLNFATFHMGATSDEHSTEFDEENKQNQADAQAIAKRLAAFHPTIVCVEVPRERNDELAKEYASYLAAPTKSSTYYGEVGLVAFEVARLAGLSRLHGIDHKLSYNYRIGGEIENAIDPETLAEFNKDPFALWPELRVDEDSLSLLEKLRLFNTSAFLDFLITVNADMLALAGTENSFEGADEAAKYYQRNLRIYSNLNRIPMTKDDRVLIISGGSHTAFLGEFMQRCPKFEVVDTANYLR